MDGDCSRSSTAGKLRSLAANKDEKDVR